MLTEAPWVTRSVVHMSGLHLESLVKRIGGAWAARFPLGRLVREHRIETVLGATTAEQLRRFAPIYNAAKHDIPVDEDQRLFSQKDAVRAYLVSSKLAALLYPHVRLSVSLSRFEVT